MWVVIDGRRERPFILIVVSPARVETSVFWVIPSGVSDHLISADHVLTHWYGPDVPRNIWYGAALLRARRRLRPLGDARRRLRPHQMIASDAKAQTRGGT